jgi:N-acetylglutamate synthase-like GNAT family acetyltransferase
VPLPGLTLRAARHADLAAIRRLVDEAIPEPDGARLAATTERIARTLDLCVVAEYRESTIGHISCWQDEMLGVVGSHMVSKPYRGLGAGGALLAHTVKQARDLGLRLLEVSFDAEACRASHLYERHGFRPIGSHSPDGWNRYERRLDGPT